METTGAAGRGGLSQTLLLQCPPGQSRLPRQGQTPAREGRTFLRLGPEKSRHHPPTPSKQHLRTGCQPANTPPTGTTGLADPWGSALGFHTETGDGTAGTKRESKWKRSCNAGPGRASRTPSGGHADRSPGGGTAGHRDPGQHRGETEAREGLRVARPLLTSQPDRWLKARMSRSGHKWDRGIHGLDGAGTAPLGTSPHRQARWRSHPPRQGLAEVPGSGWKCRRGQLRASSPGRRHLLLQPPCLLQRGAGRLRSADTASFIQRADVTAGPAPGMGGKTTPAEGLPAG